MTDLPNTMVIKEWRAQLLREAPVLRQKIAQALPEESGEEVLEEALKFLALIGHYSRSLSPSHKVDLAWHELILCTRLYHGFCQEHFGRYIHHTPGGSTQENQSKHNLTIRLYIKHFGEPARHIWGKRAQEEWLDAQCGSCKAN